MRRQPLLAVSRRGFLGLAAAGAGAALVPVGCASKSPDAAFLTGSERSALEVLADHVLPADREPGGAALGVVDYIERLMTAFDHDPPRIFAGGPFSNRDPFSESAASPNKAPDAFASYIALDRVNEAAWRLKIYGSSGLPGGGPNDAVLGPQKGMRDTLRDGLKELSAAAPQGLDKLSSDDLEKLLAQHPEFRTLIVELTLEGAFAAPEYGGNRGGAGWDIAHWEGDTLPLGFSFYDPAISAYRERDAFPVSKANPGADPAPLDDETIAFVTKIAQGL
jgi:hypothetical protein